MENHIEVEETKQDKGFTLVELLIVIVILGILATVTVFAVTGITNRARPALASPTSRSPDRRRGQQRQHRRLRPPRPTSKANGLLHDVSPNFTVALVAAAAPRPRTP